MKNLKDENQYTGGKRNIEDNRKPRLDNTRDSLKKRGLFRNAASPDDYEDDEINSNHDYRLRANRQETKERSSQRYQQNSKPNKMDSVKSELRIRSKEYFVHGKTGNRNNDWKNEDRAENS